MSATRRRHVVLLGDAAGPRTREVDRRLRSLGLDVVGAGREAELYGHAFSAVATVVIYNPSRSPGSTDAMRWVSRARAVSRLVLLVYQEEVDYAAVLQDGGVKYCGLEEGLLAIAAQAERPANAC